MKEHSVKSKFQELFNDNEESQQVFADELAALEKRAAVLETEKKRLSKELSELKREKRTVDDKLRERDGELEFLQNKYEEVIEKMRADRKDQDLKHKQVLDGLQYELDFFKKALEKTVKENQGL